MMGEAASRLGIELHVLDPAANPPAKAVARHHQGPFTDKSHVLELAQMCDALTVEIEHVNAEGLREATKITSVSPHPETIATIQDKLHQKQHLQKAQVPVGAFAPVGSVAELREIAKEFGLPLMLKSRLGAYDGRGNAVIKTMDDIESAVKLLQPPPAKDHGLYLYAEKWVPFEKEIAVMAVRSLSGETRAYPPVETIHVNSILNEVICPAPIPMESLKKAQEIAMSAVRSFGGAGVFGVEMFYLKDGTILLNEMAPRPHNSGHYTIEACYTDQFENHLRAVCGLPLGCCDLKVAACTMLNILGSGDDEQALADTFAPCARSLSVDGASLHWYCKEGVRLNRKMGHITVVGDSADVVAERAAVILGREKPRKSPTVGIIMGSDSDLPTMRPAAQMLQKFDVPFEVTIVSAHRTPERMVEYAKMAATRGLKVIIAGAGGAAHLPGMVAAITPLPVIGVPVALRYLDGQDSLYSIVQMPRGVPVATVAINNATNAGLLAVRMLGAHSPALLEKMQAYQHDQRDEVLRKVEVLEDKGWESYGQ
eukprot:CAMPEP_0177643880 /NCGR_PEP_ID=MMETSP0447-20121125/8385_1 /TAXON_ID=0 /ORGANISM="Stygamoeba regulata, Strain BSH-02190019" /LENGTH=539 /DNA_ID=CAMNT_0019146193 /DNA_START=87 /DNA_END=1706 /DNA_ORIENTATION=+